MMNTIDRITNELATGKKISEALATIYSKRNVVVPYNSEWFDVDVRELKMTTRTINGLMRTRLRTINDIMEYVQSHKISEMRNMGISSCQEIMETILDYAWTKMSEREKAEFLIDTVVRNERYLKA
jgi:DNA-directed RNA polymerase alpha subunit